MATAIDICNLALAHLGDSATVSSITPPEGSAQAEHCARFYPIARDSLLERHNWNFATLRRTLALLASPAPPEWGYVYDVPSDVLRVLAVYSPDASDELIESGVAVPQNFVRGIYDLTDTPAIFSDTEGAVLRYVQKVADPNRFSPLFVDALSYQLAGYLAGPVYKGEEGVKLGKQMRAVAEGLLTEAKQSDANQRRLTTEHRPASVRAR